MVEVLQNRYVLRVTRCRKLKPEGVEVVLEIRPKSQAGQEPSTDCSAATASSKTPSEASRE